MIAASSTSSSTSEMFLPNREIPLAATAAINSDLFAYHAVQPDRIRLCSSVRDFHSQGEIKDIPLSDFIRIKKLREYNPCLKLRADLVKKVWLDMTFPKNHVTQIEDELFDPKYTDQFVLVNMGNEMGDGLFLAHDAKPIKVGSLVLTYSGEYCEAGPAFEIRDYGLKIDPSLKNEYNCVLIDPKKLPSVDAVNGNLARFVQGGLDQGVIDQINDIDNILNKVAVANLIQRVVIYQGFPILCLQAFRDINPGEMFSFTYGLEYFEFRQINFQVCDDYGHIIGQIKDRILTSVRAGNEISELPNAARLNESLCKEIFFSAFKSNMVFDCHKQFYNSVCHALSTGLQMVTTTKQRKFVAEIFAAFKAAKTSKDQSAILSDRLRKPPFRKDDLLFLRRHLQHISDVFKAHEEKMKEQRLASKKK